MLAWSTEKRKRYATGSIPLDRLQTGVGCLLGMNEHVTGPAHLRRGPSQSLAKSTRHQCSLQRAGPRVTLGTERLLSVQLLPLFLELVSGDPARLIVGVRGTQRGFEEDPHIPCHSRQIPLGQDLVRDLVVVLQP